MERVFGTVGRATTSTDNTPMGMVNTTVTLQPKDEWRPGLTTEALQSEMDAALQFPGFPNVWTQPIRNRLDMLLTGIKTPVGIKIFGADLAVIQRIGRTSNAYCRTSLARAACMPSGSIKAISRTSRSTGMRSRVTG